MLQIDFKSTRSTMNRTIASRSSSVRLTGRQMRVFRARYLDNGTAMTPFFISASINRFSPLAPNRVVPHGADIEGGVRPGGLRQIFDGDADPPVAFHQQDIARPQLLAQNTGPA